jgi:glutamine synthetase
MHTHQSLFSGNTNHFYDANDEYHLSETAKHYIAGLLRHAPEICSVICQWVNSYKRLVPGYEAPVYICWARRNRSAMVRIPMYKPGKEAATRVEFRAPDPACNPYLAFAVMLAAGLRGIKEKYPLPPPVEKDVYDMSEAERARLDIARLPSSLGEAITLTERSDLVRETLGNHIFEAFIRSKKIEWEQYRTQVHPYEIREYLPVL